MTQPDDGWGSNGLGLDEKLFGGASRVDSFSDPVWPEVTGAPTAAPAAAAQRPVAASPAGEPGVVLGAADVVATPDPLRAARDLLMAHDEQPTEPAQWGARAVLRRTTGGLLRPGASRAEKAYNADLDVIRNFQWPGPFSVLVANKKGGVAKTPTCVLLAGVLAQVRSGGVVAFEGAEAAGTLAMRAERAEQTTRGLTELLVSLPDVRNAANLAWFTQLQSSGAAVIGSVNDRTTLEEKHVRALRRLLDQYYPVNVVDTGNNPESGAFLQCVESADALVLPTVLTKSSVVALIDTLFRVRNDGPKGAALAAHAVVVISDDGKAVDGRKAAQYRQVLSELGVGAVVDVPFDPHINEGNEISLGRLTPVSQRAWVHATAQVVACATASLTTGRNL